MPRTVAPLKQLLSLFLAAALALLGAASVRSELAAAQRPNFVVIQTDDQHAATMKGFFRDRDGRYRRMMPNTVKGIVRQGAEFRNYYTASPVCSPSRASLLTGRYPHNNGLLRNNGPWGGWRGWQALPTWTENVPVALSRAGYRTAHFGKLINGYFDPVNNRVGRTVPPGWDRWYTTAFMPGARYYGYRVNDDGLGVGPVGDPRYRLGGRGMDPPICSAASLRRPGNEPRCKHLTDRMTRKAVNEIHAGHRPFFIQIDYQAPHGDVRPPAGPTPQPRHIGTAARTPLPRPPNFNEADMSDKPDFLRERAGRRLGPRQIKRQTRYYRRYVESLRGVNDGIGAILKALRETGQLRNTYVFVLSDHSVFFGEHRFSRAKFLHYEAASRVAMAVRGPGVRPGTKVHEVVGNIDVPATLLRLAGVRAHYQVDGRPLGRFWRNPAERTRRPYGISMFVGTDDPDERTDHDWQSTPSAVTSARAPAVNYRGFRVGPYKYIRYRNGARELYDLARDPWERRNRIDSRRYAEVRRYMELHLPQVSDCGGELCSQELPPWPEPH